MNVVNEFLNYWPGGLLAEVPRVDRPLLQGVIRSLYDQIEDDEVQRYSNLLMMRKTGTLRLDSSVVVDRGSVEFSDYSSLLGFPVSSYQSGDLLVSFVVDVFSPAGHPAEALGFKQQSVQLVCQVDTGFIPGSQPDLARREQVGGEVLSLARKLGIACHSGFVFEGSPQMHWMAHINRRSALRGASLRNVFWSSAFMLQPDPRFLEILDGLRSLLVGQDMDHGGVVTFEEGAGYWIDIHTANQERYYAEKLGLRSVGKLMPRGR